MVFQKDSGIMKRMIDIIPGYDRIDEVRKLFSEYTAMLVSINPSFQLYLDIQHYGDEERNPSMKYQLPDGRLYLALKDNKIAGCVALRRLDDENGELKRLYVRPEFRGNGIASLLMEKIIEDVREVGYRSIFLDTLPELESAVKLYLKLGFEFTSPYNDSPVEKTLFMKKKL